MNSLDFEFPKTVSENAARTVQQVLDRGSQAQAVLLYGAEGAGMNELATWLCGRWLSGTDQLTDLSKSVDCEVFDPVGASNWITIHAIREVKIPPSPYELTPLNRFFQTRPLVSATKVGWLKDADRLFPKAGNSALKLLEELPPYARMVLTTSNLARVIPTIRSRCLTIACGSVLHEGSEDGLSIFSETVGQHEFIVSNRAVFSPMLEWLDRHASGDSVDPLKASEMAREAGRLLSEHANMPMRLANSEVVKAIGYWVLHKMPTKPDKIQAVAECYRALIGNVNSSVVFDSLFLSVFTDDREL